MGPIALVIAAVVGLVVLIIKNWDTIKNYTIKAFQAAWDFLKKMWEGVKWLIGKAIDGIKYIFLNFTPLGLIIKNWGGITKWITDLWNNVVDKISGAINRIKGFFKGMWDGIVNGLKSALNGIIDTLNGGIYGINVLISGANSIPGVNIPQIPYIPFLASGGITTGPTMAMIGEGAEQEAVLPLSKLQGLIDMNRGGGSGMQVSFAPGGGDLFMEWLMETIRIKFGGDVNRLGTESAR